MIATNDEPLNRRYEAWQRNFGKKVQRGVFEREKAIYALKKYLLPEVKRSPSWDEDIDVSKINFGEIVDNMVGEEVSERCPLGERGCLKYRKPKGSYQCMRYKKRGCPMGAIEGLAR